MGTNTAPADGTGNLMPAFGHFPARPVQNSRSMTVCDLLYSWLDARLADPARAWLATAMAAAAANDTQRWQLAFGLAPRKVGKDDLALDTAALAQADAARAGWQPGLWTCAQAVRVGLLLALPAADADTTRATIDDLARTADVHELVALYQGLPLYAHPQALRDRAAEGLRSNMQAVFDAVALYNPFPAEHFDEGAWNQMILKALFIGTPLHPVQGIDQRANPALTRMLCDYAHERWAASRPIRPDLWRCVGQAADDPALNDLERALTTGPDQERDGAALACAGGAGRSLLERIDPDRSARIDRGDLTWQNLPLA